MMAQDFYAESRGAPFRCYAEKGSLSPTLSTREGAKSLPLWGADIEYVCLRQLDICQQRSAFRLRGGSSMFLAKRCFLLGFIVRWWHTTVECLWMGVKACLLTNRHKHNTRHLQDENNKYKLFFLFLSKQITSSHWLCHFASRRNKKEK